MAERPPGPQFLLTSPLSKTTLLPGKAELRLPRVLRGLRVGTGVGRLCSRGKMSGFGACQLLLLWPDLGSWFPCPGPHRREREGCPGTGRSFCSGTCVFSERPAGAASGLCGTEPLREPRLCPPGVSLHPERALVPAHLLLARCPRSPYDLKTPFPRASHLDLQCVGR